MSKPNANLGGRGCYPAPTHRFTRATFGLFALVVMLGLISLFSLLSGCVYRGAKIVEGADLAVGINVPSTEGALQLQLLNYLSGFRLGVAENAALEMTYTTAESNNYFGVISTRVSKTVTATVSPTESQDLSGRATSVAPEN